MERFFIGVDVLRKSLTSHNEISLRFPNGRIFKEPKASVEDHFMTETDTKNLIISKMVEGEGTPPQAFFPYLPETCDWRKKYSYHIVINLIEKGEKEFLCRDCYGELKESDTYCERCKREVTPVNIKAAT